MARRRKRGEDLTYAEWHRHVLEHHYRRIGHRMHMGDRDWTEICGYCSEPLLLKEEVVDRGQDLNDKAVTWTRRLAKRADLHAMLVAPRIERQGEVQERIDALWSELLGLYALDNSRIVGFKVKEIYPNRGSLVTMTPEEWREHLLMLHRRHHETCQQARRRAPRVKRERLEASLNESRLFTPDGQTRLWMPGDS